MSHHLQFINSLWSNAYILDVKVALGWVKALTGKKTLQISDAIYGILLIPSEDTCGNGIRCSVVHHVQVFTFQLQMIYSLYIASKLLIIRQCSLPPAPPS